MPSSLAELLPKEGQPPLTPDEVLSRFIGYAAEKGLVLYSAQEEAMLELSTGNHLVLATPTGSGKSLVAQFLHFKALAEGKRSFYTCPIKALVNEKFFQLCEAFGPDRVGMSTGDASINRDAQIICCTAEVLANLALREKAPEVHAVVMDEFHYYADRERGVAWQVPLLLLPDTTFLLMSATLGDMTAITTSLEDLTGRLVSTVRSGDRPVPLHFEYRETPLHETVGELVEKKRAPVYLVNFSQKSAAEEAQNLMSQNFSSKEEKEEIRKALFGARFDTPYGKELQKFLRHGLGIHHAGLLPKYRLTVERLAQTGLLKVVSGTDTLGVGVNIPIRTVLFTKLFKYSGEKNATLSVRDFQQIAGRAGRKGFDDEGLVVAQAPEHVIENKKLEEKAKGGKKVVKQKPPERFIHYDAATFEKLRSGMPEPLESRFQVTHGMLLALLQSNTDERGGGYGRLVKLIGRSHSRDYDKRRFLKTAALYFRTLRDAYLINVVKGRPAVVKVDPDLQDDFSLNHTLSLYLLETLKRLDPAHPDYALDALSLVEAILEDPDPVLWAQLNRLKGEKVNELKAQGVEYDQRMAELEKLEYPKPQREFIYGTFNDFALRHPWVGQENIRPKSVAREMVETFASFNEYVRDYALQRSEGLLLRHLSQVYKTLAQNVPEQSRTEELELILAFLRTTIRQTDSSLLEEWMSLKSPGTKLSLQPGSLTPTRERDILDDRRAFGAQVRAELHALLKALAAKDYEAAADVLYQPGSEWPPEKLEAEMARYFEEHPTVDVTPRARKNEYTRIEEETPRHFLAQQKLVDPAGEADWMLDCFVDLTGPHPTDRPLIQLRRIAT